MSLRLFDDCEFPPRWPVWPAWPSVFEDTREPSSIFGRMDAEMRRMQSEMESFFSQAIRRLPEEDRREFLEQRADDHAGACVEERDGKKILKYNFDVQNFKPEEITVKATNNAVTVHARHESNDGQGRSVYREHRRHFSLPEGINGEQLLSRLSTSGVLSIEAPLPENHAMRDPCVIPIQREGCPAVACK